MADFMEAEAVESDSDGSEDLARKKRPVGCLFVPCCLFVSLFQEHDSQNLIKMKHPLNRMPGGRQF